MREFKIQKRTILGSFVIFVGSTLLLSALGIISKDIDIGTFWPVVLIILGIIRIVNFDESTFVGFIFLILGVYFQLKNLNVDILENTSFGKIFWPAIIILFGLSMILPDKYKSKKYNVNSNYYSNEDSIDVEYNEEDR